ncbi:MAG: hypothetical protein AAGH15_11445 [Myxococcota bacterium]
MVQATIIRCPSCGADGTRPLEGTNERECGYCGTRFVVSGGTKSWGRPQAPAAPAPAPAAAPRPPTVRIIAATALAFLVVGAGLVVRIAMEDRPPPTPRRALGVIGTTAPPKPTSGVAPAAAPSAAPVVAQEAEAAPVAVPKAELRHLRDAVNRSGARFWIGEIVNVGELAIERPAIVVSLFDEAGARVGEQSGYARREVLAPGDAVPVLALITHPPAFARAEVVLRELQPQRYSRVADLQVVESRVLEGSFGGKNVVGTVRNPTEGPVRFPKVLVVGRDAGGHPVALADGFATDRNLAAGQTTGFSVRVGTFTIEEPARWEVNAFARPE